jgi:replicative DNA helicase
MSARAHKPSWFDVQPRAIDGKEPPSDLDAEQRVKTAMLIVPGFIDRVCPPLEPEHFYSEANRRIVESILAVRARDGEVDTIRVVEHLSEIERLHQVGGAKALATPAKFTDVEQREAVSAARAVWSLHHRRTIALHLQQATAALYLGGVEMRELLDGIEQRTYELCRSASRAAEAQHVSEGLSQVVASINGGVNPIMIPSGLKTFDDAIDEMRTGEFSIVGAGTGIGKTSFALGVLVAAAKRGFGGLYVSTEMKHSQLSQRMLAAESGQSVRILRRPKSIDERVKTRFIAAADRLRNLPIHIDAEPFVPGKSIASIRAQARRIATALERRGAPLRLIVVDYLQDLQLVGGDRNSSEWQRLRDAATSLNALAIELDVHIMALSQLTVSDKAAKDYEPQLSDLAGSKAIARPASVVTIIVRDPNDVVEKNDPRTIAKLLIRKMRNGGQSTRTVIFDGPLCRFADSDQEMGRDDSY